MAGNNLIQFLRGGLGRNNGYGSKKLNPGQPFYNTSKGYLTIGGGAVPLFMMLLSRLEN